MKHLREDIIQTGQELFREHGYHATGVSAILEACDISKGTFYNYFNSKEEFALECLTNYSSQIQKLLKTYLGFTSMSPTKRLKRYFDQLVKINAKEGANRGCLLMNFMVELAGQDSIFQKQTEEEFSIWIDLITPTIEEAQRAKEITNAYPAKQIAHYLYLHVFGDFARMKTIHSTNQLERQLKMVFDFIKTS